MSDDSLDLLESSGYSYIDMSTLFANAASLPFAMTVEGAETCGWLPTHLGYVAEIDANGAPRTGERTPAKAPQPGQA